MKIATWNVEGVRPRGRERTVYIREAIGRIGADIWILTESHPEFMPAEGYRPLAVSTPAAYRVDGCWVAIWIREDIVGKARALNVEADRSAGACVLRPGGHSLFVFGTVLPWRADARYTQFRGGIAFERALKAQAAEWQLARKEDPDAELCVAGDFNQELGAEGPAGTHVGRVAFDEMLKSQKLTCVTGGDRDPLYALGWGTNVDHILLSNGLRMKERRADIWPKESVLPTMAPDHYGVCITLAEA